MSKASSAQNTFRGVWSQDEHDLFLEALQLYPQGPWKKVAEHIGTRSVRQVQTHAQKYHEKVARRLLGLRKERKKMVRTEHRIDDEMLSLCRDIEHSGRLSTMSSVSSSASSFAPTEVSFGPHSSASSSCDSCGAWPSSASSSGYSTPSAFSSASSHSHSHSHRFEREYDEVITFGDDDDMIGEENENDDDDVSEGFGGGRSHHFDHSHSAAARGFAYDVQPTTFDIQAEAAAREAAAQRAQAEAKHQQHHHHHRELPSFHDCLDFLIDAFGGSSHERRRSSSSSSSSSSQRNSQHQHQQPPSSFPQPNVHQRSLQSSLYSNAELQRWGR